MINDTTQTQSWWDWATLQQANGNIINIWVTYSEAKEIALATFKENMPVLASQAQSIANQRVEEMTWEIMQKLQRIDSQEIRDTLATPWMQYAIYTAQKEYAKTWDKDLSEVLQDILVERSKYKNRNILQIVHDESLIVVSKLTTQQFDILSLIFILKYTINYSVVDYLSLKRYFEVNVFPFLDSISDEWSTYSHLEFTSCATEQISKSKFIPFLKRVYWWVFFKWFTKENFLDLNIWPLENYNEIIIYNWTWLCKFNTMSFDKIEDIIDNKYWTDIKNALKSFYNSYLMNDIEIKERLLGLNPKFIDLLDKWDNWTISSMTLTSVWIAIAHANMKRKVWIDADLSMWIK